MAERDLRQIIDPDWATALEPVAGRIAAMGDFLREEIAAGRRYLPAGENVLRAFKQPFGAVRVLIMGQDPYPTPGNAVGLSFSVPPTLRRLPPSLLNIFREYSDDLGYPRPSTGDLVPWSERGVLLLNRVLTVRPGQPGSHRGLGWEEVTDQAIRALAARPGPEGTRTRCPAGGDLVGPGRAQPRPAARRRAADRVRPSQPQLCRPGLLRLPPVQPGQQAPGRTGRRTRGLEASLVQRVSGSPEGQ